MSQEWWIAFFQFGSATIAFATAIIALFAVRNWRNEHIEKRKIALTEEGLRLFQEIETAMNEVLDLELVQDIDEFNVPASRIDDILFLETSKIEHRIKIAEKYKILIDKSKALEATFSIVFGKHTNKMFENIQKSYMHSILEMKETIFLINDSIMDYIPDLENDATDRISDSDKLKIIDKISYHTSRFDDFLIAWQAFQSDDNQQLNSVRSLLNQALVEMANLSASVYVKSNPLLDYLLSYRQFINWLNYTCDELQQPSKCFFCKQEKHNQDCKRN